MFIGTGEVVSPYKTTAKVLVILHSTVRRMSRTREDYDDRPRSRYQRDAAGLRVFDAQQEQQQDNDTDMDRLPTSSSNPGNPSNDNCIVGRPADLIFDPIKALPTFLVFHTFEWLFVKDILELEKASRSLREIATDKIIWRGIACHLWKSALIDGDKASNVDVAASIPLKADLSKKADGAITRAIV